MLEPSELLDTARLLLVDGASNAASLRRAVSTAYYAVFHTVLRSAADELVGASARESGAYSTLYRAFAHRRVADICGELLKPNLRSDVRRSLGRESVSEAAKSFAWAFIELQNRRHDADYDPIDRQTAANTEENVLLAELAVACWADISPRERLDILALMLTNPRR